MWPAAGYGTATTVLMSKVLLTTIVALALAGSLVGTALAGRTRAYRAWETDPATGSDWLGTRVTVDNPAAAERSESVLTTFLTSAIATNGLQDPNGSLIQQGVTYEYDAQESPNCGPHSTPTMYYFVETELTGNYSCYLEMLAPTTDSHVQKVQFDLSGSGNWRAYMDGTYQQHQTSWYACGGNACFIAAYGEANTTAPYQAGLWHAKFAGSGGTAWQFWNSTVWNTITNGITLKVDSPWTGPSGPFPDGIWSFTYCYQHSC